MTEISGGENPECREVDGESNQQGTKPEDNEGIPQCQREPLGHGECRGVPKGEDRDEVRRNTRNCARHYAFERNLHGVSPWL